MTDSESQKLHTSLNELWGFQRRLNLHYYCKTSLETLCLVERIVVQSVNINVDHNVDIDEYHSGDADA